MKRVRVTKKRIHSEERKKKSNRNQKRGTGQLQSMEKQKSYREKLETV
jgi:hypothetical protein